MSHALVCIQGERNMNIVQHKLDVIREVKRNLIRLEDGKFTIKGKYFKNMEPEYDIVFINYAQANLFIIENLLKDLE